MLRVTRRFRAVLAAVATCVAGAGLVLGAAGPGGAPAVAQLDPTTTEAPTTTQPPVTTTTRPPTTTSPPTTVPASTTPTTTRRSSTSTSAETVATTARPADIPIGSVVPPVTAPVPVAADPGSGSMPWWIVALSPLGLAATAGTLGYNWFRTRSPTT